MKFQPSITQTLCVLQEALLPAHIHLLPEIIEQAGLEKILDPELFKAARFLDRKQILVLLATLGVENTDDSAMYRRWLAAGQLLTGQSDVADAAAMCATARPLMQDFYVDVLTAAGGSRDAFDVLGRWQGAPCTAQDLMFATELLLDQQSVQRLGAVLARWQQLDNSAEPWLWMCRNVAERVEYANTVQRASALADAFLMLFEMATPDYQSLINSLAPHLINLLLRAERGELAMHWATKLAAGSHEKKHHYWLMRCHAYRQEFSPALAHAQSFLLSILDQEIKALECTSASTQAQAKEQPIKKKFDVDAAGESLKTVNRVLRAHGLRPFLMSGVLLGYERERRLLAHDKDIDIGIIGWESQYDVAQALLAAGHYHVSWRYLRGEKTYLFDVIDLKYGVVIDFFFYHPYSDHYLHGIDYKYGFTQNLRFSPFGLKEVEFLGEYFFIPDNVDQNLSENYGEWRTPQSSYVVTVESPALVNPGSLKHQLMIVIELMRSVQTMGSVKRARRILDVCQKLNCAIVSNELSARLNHWMALQENKA